jgi:hypothetical protein
MSVFKKATKSQSKLRLAIVGVSGSGKTYTALSVGKHLGERIALIDSERGSASKYAGDVADFDVLELEDFAPKNYVKAIKAAEAEGYDVLIIDSLSHAWAGKGGALEMVDEVAARQKNRNSFTAWKDVTPEQHALVEAILQSKCHVIATMRAKTAYVQDNKTVTKVGLAPVQRDGVEYEFDVIFDIDLEHNAVVSKSRCAALDKKTFRDPGEEVALKLKRWLSEGAPVVEPVDPIVALLAAFKAATTPDAFAKATDDASALKASMTRAQVQLVSDAVRVAKARLEQLAADAAEAEEAERALAAQEAAEQGDSPLASTSTEASAAGFAPTASSSAESAQAGAL